ncbi:hypothetical protein AAFG13_38840 [Bradyrhizobium sp. B124]|uniref:hypothetical protein n=1 Tax=Bradyrhizobium sp. B124 TaxID=3140245 RepID=UPI0031845561
MRAFQMQQAMRTIVTQEGTGQPAISWPDADNSMKGTQLSRRSRPQADTPDSSGRLSCS